MDEPTDVDALNLLPQPLSRRSIVLRAGVWVLAALATVVGGTAAWAYVFGAGDPAPVADAATVPPTYATTTSTTAAPTTTTTTLPKRPQPKLVQMPEVGGGLAPGASGDVVLAYEYRLKALAFDPGAVDGVYDQATRYAVETVQKLYGFERTGRIDEAVRFALSTFRWPKPMQPKAEPDRVEIDLDRQVIILWKRANVELITTTSTGNGERFCGGDDGCQYAVTPPGRYEFTWHYNGWRRGKLGRLYNPYYFNGGIAVHGYSSVPTQPASHGCSRIPMHVAEYFPDLVWKGMPVYVLGQPAPEGGFPRSGGSSSGGSSGPPPTAAPPPPPPPPATVPATQPPVTTVPTTAPQPTTTVAPTTAPPTTAPPTTVTTAGEPQPPPPGP